MAGHGPGRVLAATLAWSWGWLAAAVAVARATGGGWLDPLVLVFVAPGLAGPFLVAVAASRRWPEPAPPVSDLSPCASDRG